MQMADGLHFSNLSDCFRQETSPTLWVYLRSYCSMVNIFCPLFINIVSFHQCDLFMWLCCLHVYLHRFNKWKSFAECREIWEAAGCCSSTQGQWVEETRHQVFKDEGHLWETLPDPRLSGIHQNELFWEHIVYQELTYIAIHSNTSMAKNNFSCQCYLNSS